jgi:hypothetical protein
MLKELFLQIWFISDGIWNMEYSLEKELGIFFKMIFYIIDNCFFNFIIP